ncbi:MAG: hypothetical protein N2593_01845 [Patescibacteria group bacterium]|nr:hypothetical protein [Patescibacteria group bacterium]
MSAEIYKPTNNWKLRKEFFYEQIKNREIIIKNWRNDDIKKIFEILEKPNWAPWLRASAETLEGRAKTFLEGQFLMIEKNGIPLVSLSTNRTFWNGNPNELPSWDEVAGDPPTFENTYQEAGNTLCLMSMNVNPEYQNSGLASLMIDYIINNKMHGTTNIIGSFRPNGFGKYKIEHPETNFSDYCSMTREDGLPIDPWLRTLIRNGMMPICVDPNAMRVEVPIEEFLNFKETYKPNLWREISSGLWECGEVGSWTITDKGIAVYTESNLWGRLL